MIKVLGKITSAEFGTISDYPFLMGLKCYFSLSDGSAIGDGGRYTVNVSDDAIWVDKEVTRQKALAKIMLKVRDILIDAKINNVSELKGKPVEVTINHNTFVDFRILTEVI